GFEVLHGGVLAAVPDWIIEALNPKPAPIVNRAVDLTPTVASIRGALGVLARARPGERNTALYWTAGRLSEAVGAHTLTECEALGFGLSVGRQVGLLDREIYRTVKSAFERGIA